MEEYRNKSQLTQIWIVCALGLFIDGYDLYISSVAEPFINALFHPNPFMIGLMQAAAPMGAALGAVVMGRVSDRIGRRNLLIFNLVFFVLIAMLSACAWNNTSLCIFRFLIGFGVGADYPVCAAYLAETIPKNKTAHYITAAMFINCLASPVGVLAAWLMFKLYPHLDVWRLMFASGALPAIIALLLRARLPESFLWRVQQQLKRNKLTTQGHYRKLFSPQLFKITLCLALCWFLLDISYYGIGLFVPYVLQAVHISEHTDLLSSANEVLKSTLFINVFIMLGSFTVIFFVTKIDRIKLQKMGYFYSFVGLLILSLSHAFSDSVNVGMIFTGFILFNFFVNFGPGITTYLLPAELYATDIKATGHGFAAGAGKFGAFVGAIFMPLLQVNLGIYLTVGILSTTLLLGWILTYFLGKQDFNLDLLAADSLSFSNA
jgi:putative MFS transporter